MEFNINNIITQILNCLTVTDESARDPHIFQGYDEVVEAINEYQEEADLIASYCPEWSTKNQLLVLVNKGNQQVLAIRDYGKYALDYKDFFMKSDYIPVRITSTIDEVFLRRKTMRVIDLVSRMRKAMFEFDAKPLVVTKSTDSGALIARSVVEEMDMIIHSYDDNLTKISISRLDCSVSQIDVVDDTVYKVIIPSDELISEAGLAITRKVYNIAS